MKLSARKWITVVYWVFLCVLTHLPPSSLPSLPAPGLDKVAHVLFFVLLSLLGCWALRLERMSAVIGLSLVFIAYGAVDEWTQQWFHRTPDIRDWGSDVLGIVLGAVMYRLSARFDPARTHPTDQLE